VGGGLLQQERSQAAASALAAPHQSCLGEVPPVQELMRVLAGLDVPLHSEEMVVREVAVKGGVDFAAKVQRQDLSCEVLSVGDLKAIPSRVPVHQVLQGCAGLRWEDRVGGRGGRA
jgi:hypothetical protein